MLDLETIPDPDLTAGQPGPAPDGRRSFPPVHVHLPVAIGALWLDEQHGVRWLGLFGDSSDERSRLLALSRFCEQHRPRLVTFNGRAFDVPVLLLRCLRHGVPLRFYFDDPAYRSPPGPCGTSGIDSQAHIDLMERLGEGVRRLSLHALAQAIGLPGKQGTDGSQVEALHHSGQQDLIDRYCLSDVCQTAFLLLRYQLVQGSLPLAAYQRRCAGLLWALERDGRLGWILERVDRRRLLLWDGPADRDHVQQDQCWSPWLSLSA